jgi:hypothetical protein
MATISRAAWRGVTDWDQKQRLLIGRNEWNWARRRLAWARRREVFHLYLRWAEKYGRSRGVQVHIASHLGVHKSTISRDFAWLALRGREEEG